MRVIIFDKAYGSSLDLVKKTENREYKVSFKLNDKNCKVRDKHDLNAYLHGGP